MLSTSAPIPEHDQSEIRLMGLILMQSMSIGLAVGIFNAELWIDLNDPMVNGVTYSMAAFAVQGLAYYLFKMFFQQGMDEKARLAAMERERRNRYRTMEVNFDSRRQDMEMRMQEAQLEAELKWMEDNPGKTPPWVQQRMTQPPSNYSDFMPNTSIEEKAPINLGLDFNEDKSKRVRGADGKFKKKE
tara:strand:- start:408 stop:968 length:561 start_codon:yes stop_codon:yes gene_type:complete